MNPFDPALLERLCAAAAAETPAVPTSTPAPSGWISSTYAEMRGTFLDWRTPWELTDADGLQEWLALAELADLTAAVGSWEAALTLFAPDGPCAGLYATQSPEPRSSRVVVPPEAHKPAQPLTTPNP